MTKEQVQEQIAALIREREHYVRYDYPQERIAQVDEQLALLGAKGKAPSKRATTLKPPEGTEL